MQTFLKVLFWVFFAIILIIALHELFSGGIDNMITIIKQDGFFEFIKQYFMELWKGILHTFGL